MRLIEGMIDPRIDHEARINHLIQHANPTKWGNLPDRCRAAPVRVPKLRTAVREANAG